MADTQAELRSFVLSSFEVKALTGWDDAMVEEWLNILQNFITLATTIDTNEGLGIDSLADLEAGLSQAVNRAASNQKIIDELSANIGDFLAFQGAIMAQFNTLKKRIDNNEQLHYAE